MLLLCAQLPLHLLGGGVRWRGGRDSERGEGLKCGCHRSPAAPAPSWLHVTAMCVAATLDRVSLCWMKALSASIFSSAFIPAADSRPALSWLFSNASWRAKVAVTSSRRAPWVRLSARNCSCSSPWEAWRRPWSSRAALEEAATEEVKPWEASANWDICPSAADVWAYGGGGGGGGREGRGGVRDADELLHMSRCQDA